MLTQNEVDGLSRALDSYERPENKAEVTELRRVVRRESETYNKLHKHKYRVLEVCRNLHMIMTGKKDGISSEEAEDMASWLRDRVLFWEHRPGQPALYTEFDNHVLKLADTTIAMWNTARKFVGLPKL